MNQIYFCGYIVTSMNLTHRLWRSDSKSSPIVYEFIFRICEKSNTKPTSIIRYTNKKFGICNYLANIISYYAKIKSFLHFFSFF